MFIAHIELWSIVHYYFRFHTHTQNFIDGPPKDKLLAQKQTCKVIRWWSAYFALWFVGVYIRFSLWVIGHSRVSTLLGYSSQRTTLENVINQLASLELERMSSKIKLMYMCRLEGRMLLFSLIISTRFQVQDKNCHVKS